MDREEKITFSDAYTHGVRMMKSHIWLDGRVSSILALHDYEVRPSSSSSTFGPIHAEVGRCEQCGAGRERREAILVEGK
jgi:hypothetical protein